MSSPGEESPPFRLRPPRTDADLHAFAAAGTAGWPDEPLDAAFLRRQREQATADRPRYLVLAETSWGEDGDRRVVGVGEAGCLPGAPAGRFTVEVRVRPDHRRRGVGHALYRHLREVLAPHRPAVLDCRVVETDREALGFASRRGFRPVQRISRSEMDPAGFDPAPWQGLEERLAARGIAIRTLAKLMESDPRWQNRLYDLEISVQRDVPSVDDFEPPSREEWMAAYEDNPDLLPEAYAVAVDGERYVGLSQLWASQATDRLLYTGLTGVRRSHRRRGIAAALKVRTARHAATHRASDGRPHRIRTGNEENNPMLGLNLRLGFQEIPALLVHRRWLW